MRCAALALAIILFVATSATATDPSILETKTNSVESQAKGILESIKGKPQVEAESAAYKAYFLFCDGLEYRRELYKATIKNQSSLSAILQRLDAAQRTLDAAHRQRLEKIHRASEPPIETSGLYVTEVRRGYGYVTYSIRVDVDNPGQPGKAYLTIQGKNWEGSELKRATVSGFLEADSTATLSGTTIVAESDAWNIRTWDIANVKFYPVN